MLLMLALAVLAIVLSSLFFPKKKTADVTTTTATITKNSRVQPQPLPPSPPKLPIIGNLHQLGSLPHRSLRSLSDRHGPLMLLQLGCLPVLVVSSSSLVHEITQTHDHLFAVRPAFKAAHELLYQGRDVAFAPYGEYWRETKKTTILHLLSSKKVGSYRKVREEEVAFMVEEIERTKVIDLTQRFNVLSMDVISRPVIGEAIRRRWKGDGLSSLVNESSRLMGEFYVGNYIPWLGKIAGLVTGFERRLRKAFERSDKLLEEILRSIGGEERRERRKEMSASWTFCWLSKRSNVRVLL